MSNLETINADIMRVVQNDPLMLEWFGVEGPGEGLVFFADDGGRFKAKGGEHATYKGKSAPICPNEVHRFQNIREFVTKCLPPWRLEQGRENSEDADGFLQWMLDDVKKECEIFWTFEDAPFLDSELWTKANRELKTACLNWYHNEA